MSKRTGSGGRRLINILIRISFFSVLILLISCKNIIQHTGKNEPKPAFIPVTGYVVPDSLCQPPLKIQAEKPLTVAVKARAEIQEHQAFEHPEKPKILKIKYPGKIFPGQNGILFPDTVKADEIKVLCKAPEAVLARDAYSKEINPMNFSSYSRLQGLRHDQVRSMAQDRKDCLWLGTDDGLTKYDGKYFSHYTKDQGLNNNLILNVFVDSKDNIWFGSFGGGVMKFDGKYLYSFTDKNGLIHSVVNVIYEDKEGRMWFGTAGGLSVYDGQSFINYTTDNGLVQNYIRSIVQDGTGRIWISTNSGGISILDGESFTNISESEGLPKNNILSLFRDRDDNIWIGSSRYALVKYDGENFISYPLKRTQESGDELVRTIAQDNSGNLWIGTEQAGLSVFNGEFFTHYSETNGLPSNMIRCSLIDNNGNLWFGTRGAGLARYDGRLFTHLTSNDGLSNSRVMAILEDDNGDLWLGTYGGFVTRINTRTENGMSRRYFSYYDSRDGLLNGRIYSIIKDRKGRIWFGTDGGGASVFDGSRFMTYTRRQGLCSDTIRKITEDSSGNLWFASYGSGMSKFDGKNFYNYSKSQGLSSNALLSILEDRKGRLWIGTVNGGLSMLENGRFTQFSTKTGFINDLIYSIMQDNDGNLWFGTGGSGVVRYDGTNFLHVSANNQTSGWYIMSLFQNSNSDIWMGTRSGPAIIDSASLKNENKLIANLAFKAYSYEDGFTGITCNVGAIGETSDKKILIGTNDRLTIYHGEGEKPRSSAQNLAIAGISLFNEKIPWAELPGKSDTSIILHNGVSVGDFRFDDLTEWNAIPVNLSLKHNNNYLTFNYISVSLKNNSKIRYQHKLDGFEQNWNLPTERTEVSYGNLQHGSYIFKLRAVDSNGVMSDEVAYPFVIRPPWYKTILFRASLLLLILVIIFSYINYRIYKLKKDKELLQQKVDEQTSEIMRKNQAIEKTNQELIKINSEKDKFFSIIAHDLRGPFSAMMMLTEEMASQINELEKEEIRDMLNAMQTSSTNLFRLLENLLNWSRVQRGKIPFEPENLNLLQLLKESLIILSDQANAKKINVVISVPSHITVFADKDMLHTIIRNLVSNAIKFTHTGGTVTVDAHVEFTKEVIVSVKDTGIGMSAGLVSKIFRIDEKINRTGTEGETSTGLGLLLCREFVEKHNGKIWVESTEGSGSEFKFSIPSEFHK